MLVRISKNCWVNPDKVIGIATRVLPNENTEIRVRYDADKEGGFYRFEFEDPEVAHSTMEIIAQAINTRKDVLLRNGLPYRPITEIASVSSHVDGMDNASVA